MSDVVLESEITCQRCGHKKQEVMPENACMFFMSVRHVMIY
ncbi:MAG: C4-type Zn-finger protein [Glaciecola sp.]|jgi:C4-type Zn-finger protein